MGVKGNYKKKIRTSVGRTLDSAEGANEAGRPVQSAPLQFDTVPAEGVGFEPTAEGYPAAVFGLRRPTTPQQMTDLDRIKRAQQHLLRLINGVLNFARLEAGKIALDLRDVSLEAARCRWASRRWTGRCAST
jgi:signal transduction histidine kinase